MNYPKKVIRTWRGWTTRENAPVYEAMLVKEVFPEVRKKGVRGLEEVSISTKFNEDDVTFFLILQFDSLASVKKFAGENYETAYIPENARRVLLRYDDRAEHYELREEIIL